MPMRGVVLLLFGLLLAAPAAAQLAPDQAADLLLSAGRRAFNEKNYTFAAGRFRFGGNRRGLAGIPSASGIGHPKR